MSQVYIDFQKLKSLATGGKKRIQNMLKLNKSSLVGMLHENCPLPSDAVELNPTKMVDEYVKTFKLLILAASVSPLRHQQPFYRNGLIRLQQYYLERSALLLLSIIERRSTSSVSNDSQQASCDKCDTTTARDCVGDAFSPMEIDTLDEKCELNFSSKVGVQTGEDQLLRCLQNPTVVEHNDDVKLSLLVRVNDLRLEYARAFKSETIDRSRATALEHLQDGQLRLYILLKRIIILAHATAHNDRQVAASTSITRNRSLDGYIATRDLMDYPFAEYMVPASSFTQANFHVNGYRRQIEGWIGLNRGNSVDRYRSDMVRRQAAETQALAQWLEEKEPPKTAIEAELYDAEEHLYDLIRLEMHQSAPRIPSNARLIACMEDLKGRYESVYNWNAANPDQKETPEATGCYRDHIETYGRIRAVLLLQDFITADLPSLSDQK